VDTTKTITHIGLCAGYGGIELGLKRVLPTMQSVALCEIEAFPIANLVAKMEAGLMESAPIWTDLKTFPWESFRDRVDILTGGYPCQPFSAAGKRAGKDDPRHLWPWIADGIRILRPRMCFFENVEGHISLGLREVIGELEEIGYKVSFGIFSAREIGAPHHRKRVFILAYLKCAGLEGLYKWYTPSEQTQLVGADSGASCQRSAWEGCLANSNDQHGHGEERGGSPEEDRISSEHREEEHSRRELGRADAAGGEGCGELADAKDQYGRHTIRPEAQDTKSALRCQYLWPSRPGEPQHGWEPPRVVGNAESEQSSSRDHRGEQGTPCQQEQVQLEGGDCGTLRESNGQTQPSLGGDPHGPADWMDYAELYTTCDSRIDELRLLGNGVVPATAERAFRTLLKDITCQN
jgi:DNA (cytosine-5)-methyltransferase 1